MINNEKFSQEIKSKKYVVDRMTEILNDGSFNGLSEKVKKDRKTGIIINIAIGAVLGLIVGLVIGIQGEDVIVGLFTGGILFLLTLIGIPFICKNAKNKYAEAIAPKVIDTMYGPNAVYQKNGGYSADYLSGLNCFRVNSLSQEDYIQGHYCSIPFTMGDVTSWHYEVRGSGKNKRTEKVIDFCGSVLSFRLNKKSSATIKVVEGSNFLNGDSINFESSAFNKKFNVYCQDKENAFYIITPQLQLAMLDIEKSMPGGIVFLFRGEELVIVISGNTTTFDRINLNKDANYNINAVLDSILAPAFIIESMNLDHKFFVSEEDSKKDETAATKEEKLDEEDKASVMKGVAASGAEGIISKEETEEIKKTIDEIK